MSGCRLQREREREREIESERERERERDADVSSCFSILKKVLFFQMYKNTELLFGL